MSIMALREDVGHDDASPPLSTLLYFVQLLVDQHRHEHQQKYPRPDAKRPHRDGKPVDLGQQFRLLLVHVRTRVIQKQLVIPVHGECALVDQEDDQTNCENSEDHPHDSQRHKPPRPDSNPSASGFPLPWGSKQLAWELEARPLAAERRLYDTTAPSGTGPNSEVFSFLFFRPLLQTFSTSAVNYLHH